MQDARPQLALPIHPIFLFGSLGYFPKIPMLFRTWTDVHEVSGIEPSRNEVHFFPRLAEIAL